MENPKKLSGANFKRRRQKMLFYLSTLNMAKFLTNIAPKVPKGDADMQNLTTVESCNH